MALFPPLLVGNPQEFAPEAAVEAGGLSHQGPDMEVVQQRGLYGPWQCQVCREAAPGTRDMVLLGLFLAFSISAPMRTNCGGGVVAWIVGTVTTPTAQGSWWPRAQKIWHCQNLFLVSDGWHPWLVLWSFSVDQCIRCSNPTPSGCVSSLLFSTPGTQKAIISGVFSIKCQHWCVGRESSECSPHCVRLSSSTLPPWLPRFPPEAFFTTNSKERDNN